MCVKLVSGIVDDIAMCNDVLILGDTWVPVMQESIGKGWTWDGERFMPPEIEEVTNEITD